MITNNGVHILEGIRLGNVYVIEIVPSSALGNGSATATTISEFHISHTKNNRF